MNEAWICDFVRTPVGRFGGSLARLRTDELAAAPLRRLMARHSWLGGSLDEVFMGCANQAGEDNRNVARMAALLSGLPPEIPGVTLNRLCASGMEAAGAAARAIQLGEMAVAVAAGVESMSRAPFVMPKAETAFQRAAEIHDTTIGWRFINPAMQQTYGVDSLPQTGENVAAEHGISRADQDAYALRSQQRTAAASASGFLPEQIFPVEVPGGKTGPVVVAHDEHPRPETTLEVLAKLRPAVNSSGTVTAGNASGVNDGAAALLLASEAAISRHGLTPLARYCGMASAGVPPRVMGMGPVPATNKLLARLGWKLADVDIIELNEAFASQALACLRTFGLPDDAGHVNPNGGAIAIGHPLGMSGTRIVGCAVQELVRRGGRRAIATMCVGVGQGLSFAVERE